MEERRYNRRELSNHQYHALDAISSSHLKCIHSLSLKHYKHKYLDAKDSFAQSEAMSLGSYVHAKILDPESIDSEFVISPKIDKRTKAGKQAFAELLEQSKGKTLIKPELAQTGDAMAAKLHEHEITQRILDGAVTEESIVSNNPFCGMMKCRADILNEKHGFVADIKISNVFSFFSFENDIRKYAYDLQAGFYCDMWSVDDFLIINIESEPPYDIVVYEFSSELIQLGRNKYNAAIDKLIKAKKSGNWPGRAEGLQVATLKKWEEI